MNKKKKKKPNNYPIKQKYRSSSKTNNHLCVINTTNKISGILKNGMYKIECDNCNRFYVRQTIKKVM